MAQMKMIAVAELHPHPQNPRFQLREDVVERIMAEIRREEIIPDRHALTVRRNAEGFEIISGHHRYEAAQRLGLAEVPCWVEEFDDDEAFIQLVASNAQGELSPLEIGCHAHRFVGRGEHGRGKKGGLSAFAARIGLSQQRVSQLAIAGDVIEKLLPGGGFTDLSTKALYEIGKSKDLRPVWPILVAGLADKKWTVDYTAKSVDEISCAIKAADGHTDWLPIEDIATEYVKSDRFDEGKVRGLIREVNAVHAAFDTYDDQEAVADERQSFTTWLLENRPRDKKLIAAEHAEIIKRLAETDDSESWCEIRHGDFREVLADIPDNSVNLILTDPPYGDDAVECYTALGEFAARVLKPGGSLLCYAGHANLPEILATLSTRLRYWWMIALEHNYGKQQLPGKWVLVEWKPILWFVKDHRAGQSYVNDCISGSKPDKDAHRWAQGSDEVVYLMRQLTAPGDLIVDPFSGSGAFGAAAAEHGRRYLGAEIDPDGPGIVCNSTEE